MPTTTWEQMRQDIVRPFGLVTGTTSANLAANTSLVDEDLTDLYSTNDYFNDNWFVLVTSNNNANEYRRIADYVQSSGTITVSKAWPSGSDSSTSTYELMTVHPDSVQRAYNRARQIVWPHIGIVRDVETVVTGQRQFTYTIPSTIRRVNRVYLGQRYEAQNDAENLLLNGGFEDWTNATTADNWSVTGSGSPSVNQEEQTTSPTNYAVLSGNNSARLVVPGSSGTATTLVQTFNSASSDYTAVATEGMTANLSAWVYCNTSGRVSLTIDGDVQSDTHGGTGWELLTGSNNLDATDTSTVVGISVTSGAAIPVFIDEINLTIGQSSVLDRPYTPITNWDVLPPVAGASNGGVLRFTGQVPMQHRIRIVGSDILSSVNADDSTVEVDGDLLEPLYNKVRQLIADERAMGNMESYWYTLARQYESEYNNAVETGAVGVRYPRPRFKVANMDY
tara:strand:- start:624 stop:1973 length:1350 start_codon:yes stop_codon:yes gene_type:complete